MNPAEEIEILLREDAQLAPGPVVLTPLGGGVSCEIFKVGQGAKTFVVKRALAKLRVAAEWRADVGRNAVEYAFYETMAGPLSGSVPRVFFHNSTRGYFTMECLESCRGHECRPAQGRFVLPQRAHGQVERSPPHCPRPGNPCPVSWQERPDQKPDHLHDMPFLSTLMNAYSPTPFSQRCLARALWGEIPFADFSPAIFPI